ncbi:MAG: hypothetical protein JWM14_1486 [Chitinophagaceae bacterium]|nr:hypothetical protein [Chitinophagaceae bacterium]
MKYFFFLFLIVSVVLPGKAQKRLFKNVEQYSEWMMGYYQNPEPEKLYSAFEFGTSNKEIGQTGGRHLLIAFFGSIFRYDSTQIQVFYDKIKKKRTIDTHFGFVGSLWSANTLYSKIILKEYLASDYAASYKKINREKPPFNIYKDTISDPSHLDLVWADFFATGNAEDIQRIISVLSQNDELSEAARWSLTSNAIHYKKVKEILNNENKHTTDEKTKKWLNKILSDVSHADVH